MTEIFTAKTVEDAKALAAKHFGASQSDITFEVLEEPKKILGLFSSGEARVRATYISVSVSMETTGSEVIETEAVSVTSEETAPVIEETPAETIEAVIEETPAETPVVEAVVETAAEEVTEEVVTEEPIAEVPAEEVAEEVVAEEAAAEEKTTEPDKMDVSLISGEPSEAALEKLEKAKAYLSAVLEKMGVQAELVVTAGAESAMIDIVAANNGMVIGKRGETLDALQYLSFMIANRGDKEYYRIILNSANYRERRRKTLEDLAAKIAKNVLRTGRQTALEPMNPYERRIIHSAIAEIEGVSSKSVGEEPHRKVVISSTTRPPRKRRGGDRGGRQGGQDKRRRRTQTDAPPTRISMDSMKTSFEKDYRRPKPEDDLNAGLYGKIEF